MFDLDVTHVVLTVEISAPGYATWQRNVVAGDARVQLAAVLAGP